MFDINIAVQKQTALQYDKIHGISDKDVPYQEPVCHVSESDIDKQAEQEGIYIKRRFSSHTQNFGICLKRIYKQGDETFPNGEKHRAINRS